MGNNICVDIGNSRIAIGLFNGTSLENSWYQSTSNLDATLKLFEDFDKNNQVFISSVKPSVTDALSPRLNEQGFKTEIIKLDSQTCIKNTYPTMGVDRLANLVAAYKLYGAPNLVTIVIDFGTATTMSVCDDQGIFLGGLIGLGFSKNLEAVGHNLEQLPNLLVNKNFKMEDVTVLAKTTEDSILNAAILGHNAMVSDWICQCRDKFDKQIIVIATGGLANVIGKHIQSIDRIDAQMTLKGINLIGCQVEGLKDQV